MHACIHTYIHTYIYTCNRRDDEEDVEEEFTSPTCMHAYIHTYIYTCNRRDDDEDVEEEFTSPIDDVDELIYFAEGFQILQVCFKFCKTFMRTPKSMFFFFVRCVYVCVHHVCMYVCVRVHRNAE